VVTGSTRGLGEAMAHGLASAGAAVVVTGRSQARCAAVAAEIAGQNRAPALGLACELTDRLAVRDFVHAVDGHYGRIDVLVNNAGVNPEPVSITDMPAQLWDETIAVNVTAPMHLSALVHPLMARRGSGSIINIATMAAYTGSRDAAAYSVSKGALLVLTRVMAREWARDGIRVNAISPGPFRTDIFTTAERTSPATTAAITKNTLLRRVAEAEEIMGAVIYLASDASTYVTGEDHAVAGGIFRS
jgi:NAD(P)-dependent dehydrogenase (short-subunit alcohol dehydrogenase family)